MKNTVKIIGAGLAGSEAALFCANQGVAVTLFEMRPLVRTNAHLTGKAAELVCSNSLKSSLLTNACGILKAEMSLLGSIMIEAADNSAVPAGNALAVDRNVFSEYIDQKLNDHPLITRTNQEIVAIPEFSADEPLIIASGPLTSSSLYQSLKHYTGNEHLAFYDAIAPIFYLESIDTSLIYKKSRYEQGDAAYWNIPFTEEQYNQFITDVLAADKYTGNELVEAELDGDDAELRPFEGCMPIEDLAERGPETLRFGPLKPKGLRFPGTEITPHAVLQLRQDDTAGNIWSAVGMQSRMKRHAQDQVFRKLTGLANVEFVRYGSFHRNTFINSPQCLNATMEAREHSGLFFAGQITGVEGYVESAAGGILAGINAVQKLRGQPLVKMPAESAYGSLFGYISSQRETHSKQDFQPINMSFGIMPNYFKLAEELGKKKDKRLRKLRTAQAAIESVESLISKLNNLNIPATTKTTPTAELIAQAM